MRDFLPMSGVAEVLQVAVGTVRRLVHRADFIDPDVVVGAPASAEIARALREGRPIEARSDLVRTTEGWSRERVILYGVDVGRLDKRGGLMVEPTSSPGRPMGRTHVKRKASWSREPELFLSYMGIAHVVGVRPTAIWTAHLRGYFADPAVRIGEKKYGWNPHAGVHAARQLGLLSGDLS